MILDKRRITIEKVARDVCLSFESCQAMMYVLGKKRAVAKIVPKLLNFE